jgi:hypothetical protein
MKSIIDDLGLKGLRIANDYKATCDMGKKVVSEFVKDGWQVQKRAEKFSGGVYSNTLNMMIEYNKRKRIQICIRIFVSKTTFVKKDRDPYDQQELRYDTPLYVCIKEFLKRGWSFYDKNIYHKRAFIKYINGFSIFLYVDLQELYPLKRNKEDYYEKR